PNSFHRIAQLFCDLPEVDWIQGLNSFIDLEGNLIHTQTAQNFNLIKFLAGDFKWIQQESTLWRRSLWEKAGGRMDDRLKLAGDFELWFRFFQFSTLYNTTVPIGAWRKREGQLSGAAMNIYLEEAEAIRRSYIINKQQRRILGKMKIFENLIKISKKFKFLNHHILERKRNKKLGLYKLNIT
ncbi:hypothetical protein, partial [Salinimicrobium oceani]